MAGLVLLLGALLVAATGTDVVPVVVKARAFHVVGEDGTVLVKLGTTTDGEGGVSTWNDKGQELVTLSVRESGPGAVVTYDPRSIEALGVYTTRP